MTKAARTELPFADEEEDDDEIRTKENRAESHEAIRPDPVPDLR